jgi:small subunit ribosomal protein S7
MDLKLQTTKLNKKQKPTKLNKKQKSIPSQFILNKFLAFLTKKGKQTKAEKLLKKIFLNLFFKRFSPISTLILAINNVKPSIEVRSVRVKGKTFQVPFPIRLERQINLSIKTILKSALNGKNFEIKLIEELINSSLSRSISVKYTVNQHKLAFQNRLATNYRWF